jgi:hypothetical protein
MYSRNLAVIFLAALVFIFSAPTNAQGLPVVPGLICTLTVTKEQDLHFGSFYLFGNGRITVNANAASGTHSSENVGFTKQTTPGPARFRVRGSGALVVFLRVALTATPNTLGADMPLSAFMLFPSATGPRNSVTCNQINEVYSVGATLQVGAAKTPGNYLSANTLELQATYLLN